MFIDDEWTRDCTKRRAKVNKAHTHPIDQVVVSSARDEFDVRIAVELRDRTADDAQRIGQRPLRAFVVHRLSLTLLCKGTEALHTKALRDEEIKVISLTLSTNPK